MKNRRLYNKVFALGIAGSMLVTATGCGAANDTIGGDEVKAAGRDITVTLGRQTLPNAKLPDGDTYEDNAYTRMLKEELNVNIVDEFEANGDDYDRQVSLALSSGEIPDIMKVTSKDDVKELYENDLIMDLTDLYDQYASDYLKSVYDSYDGRALDNVTFDGQMMALPGTNPDAGPSEVWIRSDWMNDLGISVDEDGDRAITIDELEKVASTFKDKNPGKAEKPVGMAFAPWLTSGDPDGTFSINSIAYALGAFPKTWMEKDGKIIYGSTQPEMKEALARIAGWFESGLVDPQLGTRTWDDITALLSNGETGVTFGTWHIPDWLLNNVRASDPKATFSSYAIEDKDGKVYCKHNDATAGYIVVSKKCKNPEVVMKIANLFYDDLVNDKDILKKYPEVAKYQKDGVDGSTRPFNIEINFSTSLLDDYSDIKKGVNGEISDAEVRTVESGEVIKSVRNYLSDPEKAEVADWARYHSRMVGIELMNTLIDEGKFEWITPVFPSTTPTMETNQANLDKLEEETFIKIATGAVSVNDGFDSFVKQWNDQGGEQIISEIENSLK